jgi:hypothetical protein
MSDLKPPELFGPENDVGSVITDQCSAENKGIPLEMVTHLAFLVVGDTAGPWEASSKASPRR